MTSSGAILIIKQFQHKVLVVGLGNHGYTGTKHNVGMAAVDALAKYLDATWSRERRLDNMVAQAIRRDEHGNTLEVLMIKPTLPMNINGRCVLKAVSKFNVPLEHILVAHDDLDTAVGKFKVKVRGSAGGHNGIKSVMASLRSDDFLRLKIGIGRPSSRTDIVDYVLEKFSPEESHIIQENMDKALKLGIHQLANKLDFDPAILGEEFRKRPRRMSARKRTISLEEGAVAGPSSSSGSGRMSVDERPTEMSIVEEKPRKMSIDEEERPSKNSNEEKKKT